MKTNTRIMSVMGMAVAVTLVGITAGLHAQNGAAARVISVNSMPPSVVKTVPQAGDKEVDPATTEIKVTFSKDMKTDHMWSFCQVSDETFPRSAGEIHYLADKRTCVMPVKLEPGKTYVVWVNHRQFNACRDTRNVPSVEYLLVFETRK